MKNRMEVIRISLCPLHWIRLAAIHELEAVGCFRVRFG